MSNVINLNGNWYDPTPAERTKRIKRSNGQGRKIRTSDFAGMLVWVLAFSAGAAFGLWLF